MGEQSEPEEAAQEMAFKQVFFYQCLPHFYLLACSKAQFFQNPDFDISDWSHNTVYHMCLYISLTSCAWNMCPMSSFHIGLNQVDGRRWLDGGYLKGNIGSSPFPIFFLPVDNFLIPSLFSGGDRRSCCHKQSSAGQVHLSQVPSKTLQTKSVAQTSKRQKSPKKWFGHVNQDLCVN